MTDVAAPLAAPAAADPPGDAPGAAAPPPAAPTRPEWLPEAFFDAKAGIKPEFGQHYSEVATFHKTETERQAALKARKPDDIKFEIKLPDGVKVPDGMKVEIDKNDPRLPIVRDLAIKNGWSQETVDAMVAIDAQSKILSHNAEVERVAAEDAKLGANGKDRKAAVTNWAKGLLDRKDITQDEFEELRLTAGSAAGVTLLAKIISKSNGAVPGTGGGSPPAQQQDSRPIEQRWYGGQKG